MRIIKVLPLIIAAGLFLASCSKSDDVTPVNPVVTDTTSTPLQSPATETFESGNKTSYNSATINLTSGKWFFDNAVVGEDAADKKNGRKAARIRENGRISMNFDIVNGVYLISIAHAVYGTDAESKWIVVGSIDGGATYNQVGDTITSSLTTLKTDSFTVIVSTKFRIQIRKISGGSNQINIDDIKILNSVTPPAPSTNDNDNLLLGNPTTASSSVLNFNNYLMVKQYYDLSYNRDEGKANWVSWHLQSTDLGTTVRSNNFREDPLLPFTWYHVGDFSYTGGGFDRGHYCPSGDRNATADMNSSTFLMTNIMPQAPQNNQGVWAHLEDSCRLLVQGGKELFIISGSYGTGGTGNNGLQPTIDNDHVTVPATLWKVIVVLPNGNNDLSRIVNGIRVIAVSMPNDNAVNTNWKVYRTSVKAIETAIGNGFNLLSNIPTAIQNVLELQVDNL